MACNGVHFTVNISKNSGAKKTKEHLIIHIANEPSNAKLTIEMWFWFYLYVQSYMWWGRRRIRIQPAVDQEFIIFFSAHCNATISAKAKQQYNYLFNLSFILQYKNLFIVLKT